jgi:hypothetical protein
MRRRLLLTAFALAHVLALLGPLAWVRVLDPQAQQPVAAEPTRVVAIEKPAPAVPAQTKSVSLPRSLPRWDGPRAPLPLINEWSDLRLRRRSLAYELALLTDPPPRTLDPTKPRSDIDERVWILHEMKALRHATNLYGSDPDAISTLDVECDIRRFRSDIECMSREIASLREKGRQP